MCPAIIFLGLVMRGDLMTDVETKKKRRRDAIRYLKYRESVEPLNRNDYLSRLAEERFRRKAYTTNGDYIYG